MKEEYFASSNTSAGFVSLFGEVFSPEKLERIYIIKGAPGSGKSTFMKKLCERARAEGFDTELYYCSADARSLDGIIIKQLATAVLDGTAPHVTDPVYPGAVESVVSFFDAFDTDGLSENADTVKRLMKGISGMYRDVYALLGSAGTMKRGALRALEPAYNQGKALKCIKKLINGRDMVKGKRTVRYVHAYGTRGESVFDIRCGEKLTVSSNRGAGELFLRDLSRELDARGCAYTFFPDPVVPELPEAVRAGNTCFCAARGKEDININTARFLNRETLRAASGDVKLMSKLSASSLGAAVGTLEKIGRAHDLLEEIYARYTDFGVIDAIYGRLEKRIFEA